MGKYSAVFFETRPLNENFKDIVMNKHMKYLDGWELTIFTTEKRFSEAKDMFDNPNLHSISNISGIQDYNSVMLNIHTWERLLNYEKILVCHSDSELLRKGIESFFQFDYIGAPWKMPHMPKKGGNGGLSLRTPKIMHSCIQRKGGGNTHEDVYFSLFSSLVGGNVAHLKDGLRFACETIFSLGTLGCHAIDKHLTPEQCKQIRTQYD